MPGLTTTDNVQSTTDEKPKSSEQIDLDDAETALNGKDYKTARGLLEKLGKWWMIWKFYIDWLIE